ncbi:dihydrofolate reductase family protein [Pollutibacter soli]|uniref:dihydrofolate reductase family protein n=1 Tax=Pollutibacter soli TaxID=3034157 RepID=UPI00301375D7
MRKVIAVMNMSLDGYCDHTEMIADDEMHQHYTDLLNSADTCLYGRTTYQLMEDFWPILIRKPMGVKAMDDFAVAIDRISKVVFSHSLKNVSWKTARLAKHDIEEEIAEIRKQPGGNILVGSPGLIVSTTNLGLVDEYQISVQPTIIGKGLPLFKNIQERINLRWIKCKTFGCGAVTHYYETKRD